MLGLGYIRFRSPLLTESRLISFPAGNEMFQFPALAPHGLYIHPRVTPSTCVVTPGCPIRRSLDQRMFDSSPEHIAAYHVLHRLSIPRHPPYTLNSLITLMKRCRVSVISSQSPVLCKSRTSTNYSVIKPPILKIQSASSLWRSVFPLAACWPLLLASSALKWFKLPHTCP